jgi:hypothetical protein
LDSYAGQLQATSTAISIMLRSSDQNNVLSCKSEEITGSKFDIENNIDQSFIEVDVLQYDWKVES